MSDTKTRQNKNFQFLHDKEKGFFIYLKVPKRLVQSKQLTKPMNTLLKSVLGELYRQDQRLRTTFRFVIPVIRRSLFIKPLRPPLPENRVSFLSFIKHLLILVRSN